MMSPVDRYSEKERALFVALGMGDCLWWPTPAPHLYEAALRRVFLSEIQGPAVTSLRRCVKALDAGRPYRGTYEWDILIQLEQEA